MTQLPSPRVCVCVCVCVCVNRQDIMAVISILSILMGTIVNEICTQVVDSMQL
jgi:hypothetical protein